jgi:carbon storage regulator CsrA
MLVLSRRVREKIYFPGLNLTVQVVGVSRGRVRVAIEAPPEVTVLRDELRGRGRNRDAANGLVAPPH